MQQRKIEKSLQNTQY